MAPTDIAYTAVSGVAGGAVNAAILASFPPGSEVNAADRMKTFWDNSGNNALYKDWPGGVTEGLLFKGGLYNDKPLLNFLASEMADIAPAQRYVDVGLTDVLSGMYTNYYASDLVGQELIDVMYGSFSYAGFFAPEAAMNSDFFSGATIENLDVFSVVNKCLETHLPEDIVVDVLLTNARTLKHVNAEKFKSMEMVWRFLHVAQYYNVMDGLLRAQFAYPTINFRHIISPTGDLPDTRMPMVSILYSHKLLELDAS
jgi:predicted acylesterase/phospholipase RssA